MIKHLKKKIKQFDPKTEILKDFQCIVKNRSIKLNFLKKFSYSDLFVSKNTGMLIPKKINSTFKNLSDWDKRYTKKTYSSNTPHFLSRHLYTVSMAEKYLNNNKRIADLGCGGAGLIKVLDKFYGFKNIYGFEHSKEMCKFNRRRFQSKSIKFINSNIQNIDERTYKNYFDVIFLTWTLGSSARPDELIDKIYKILKLNGHLIIAESSRILIEPKVSIFYYFNTLNTFKSYPWRFSFNTLRNLLLVFNFKVVKKNNFKDSDNLVVIFKKCKEIKNKNYKFDNSKKLINFFKIWLNQSLKFVNFVKK